MVSQAVIELALKLVNAQPVIDELDAVADAEKRVKSAGSGGGFGGQLEGTTVQGRQVEETLIQAVSRAQDELNDKLAIGNEHSIFSVQTKELELQQVRDVEEATARLAEKQLAQGAAAKISQEGLISFAKSLAADAGIAAAAITAAMGANKVIWGESLAMANKLAERDGEFAKATEGSRYALALLSGDFTQAKEDVQSAWKAMGDYADQHAEVVGGLVAGPIGAAVGSYIQKLKNIVSAADEAWDAADESQRKLDALAQAIANEHAEMLASGKAFYDQSIERDNALTQNRLANIAKIHRAEAELQAGRMKRAGASPEDLAANSFESNVQSAQDVKAQAEAVVKAAIDRNNKAWREVFEKRANGGKPEEIARLEDAANKTSIALEAAQSNLETVSQEAVLKLTNTGEETTQKVKDAAEKQLTDFGTNLVSELEKAQAAGQLDSRGLVVLQNVRKLIESGQKVTVEEGEQLLESAKLLRGSTSDAFGNVHSINTAILANTQAMISKFEGLAQKVAQQGVQIEQLQVR